MSTKQAIADLANDIQVADWFSEIRSLSRIANPRTDFRNESCADWLRMLADEVAAGRLQLAGVTLDVESGAMVATFHPREHP